MSAGLHLGRARAGELLLNSADVELLRSDRMSQFDERDKVLAWLEATVFPAAKMPADAPCMPATTLSNSSTAASERSGSKGSSVSSVRSNEAPAAASKALKGLLLTSKQ